MRTPNRQERHQGSILQWRELSMVSISAGCDIIPASYRNGIAFLGTAPSTTNSLSSSLPIPHCPCPRLLFNNQLTNTHYRHSIDPPPSQTRATLFHNSPCSTIMELVTAALSEIFPPTPLFTEKDLPDLSSKVYIVTGGASGIGKELCKVNPCHPAVSKTSSDS